MITLVLINYDDNAHDEFADFMCDQSCQDFEILSAPAYATLDDILNLARGDYIWVMNKGHTPAQPQTIQKLKSLLQFTQPDIIVGSFIYTRDNKKLFFKRLTPELFLHMPHSCFLIARHFLDKCGTDIHVREIIAHSIKHARTIARASFPLSVSDDDVYMPRAVDAERLAQSVFRLFDFMRIKLIESA